MANNKWIDGSNEIRKGEEIDSVKLGKYLSENLNLGSDHIEVSQFSKGFSNLTYLIKSGQREFVLRRPPFGAKVKSGHNMHREYRILDALNGHYSKSPKAFHYTDNKEIIGAPFYVMDRISGVILRANMPDGMIPNPTEMHRISQSLINTFAELHDIDYDLAGLSDLGRPNGYVERQISGWTKRYNATKTDDFKSIAYISDWLADNIPDEGKATLIHNDFKYDNVVLDPEDWSKINAVLDWEMTTLGDPLMDLGTTLGYWINHNDPDFMKRLSLSPTTLPGNPTRGELSEMYALATGSDLSNIHFYYVYGLFKIAGITQQIYYRFKNGFTTDPRFGGLIKVVSGLGEIGKRVIEKNRLDNLF